LTEAMPEPLMEDAQTHMLEWSQALPQRQAPVAVLPAADTWRGATDVSSMRAARRPARRGFRWSAALLPTACVVLVTLHGIQHAAAETTSRSKQ
jgi:hypothetical protein